MLKAMVTAAEARQSLVYGPVLKEIETEIRKVMGGRVRISIKLPGLKMREAHDIADLLESPEFGFKAEVVAWPPLIPGLTPEECRKAGPWTNGLRISWGAV